MGGMAELTKGTGMSLSFVPVLYRRARSCAPSSTEHSCPEKRTGQRKMLCVLFYFCLGFIVFCLRQDLSLNLEFAGSAGLAGKQVPRICTCLPAVLGYTCRPPSSVQRMQTQVSTLVQQTPYPTALLLLPHPLFSNLLDSKNVFFSCC